MGTPRASVLDFEPEVESGTPSYRSRGKGRALERSVWAGTRPPEGGGRKRKGRGRAPRGGGGAKGREPIGAEPLTRRRAVHTQIRAAVAVEVGGHRHIRWQAPLLDARRSVRRGRWLQVPVAGRRGEHREVGATVAIEVGPGRRGGRR